MTYVDGMLLHSTVHTDYLRTAPNLVARWSRYLTSEQVEELSNLLQRHELAMRILPGPIDDYGPAEYEHFFSQARKIKWLDF